MELEILVSMYLTAPTTWAMRLWSDIININEQKWGYRRAGNVDA